MSLFNARAAKQDFYQIKIYHLNSDAQEKAVDDYLQKAYLPALHRFGIDKIGVFKPVLSDAALPAEKLIYVFIPLKSFNSILALNEKLAKDKQYLLLKEKLIWKRRIMTHPMKGWNLLYSKPSLMHRISYCRN